jgi:hypothetical protein
MRAKGEVAGQGGVFIEGGSDGSPLFDWPRWVAAHLFVGVVGRQGLQEKEMRRRGWPNFKSWPAPFLS